MSTTEATTTANIIECVVCPCTTCSHDMFCKYKHACEQAVIKINADITKFNKLLTEEAPIISGSILEFSIASASAVELKANCQYFQQVT